MDLAQALGLALGVPILLGLFLRRSRIWWLPSLLPAGAAVYAVVSIGRMDDGLGGWIVDGLSLVTGAALLGCAFVAFVISAIARYRYKLRVNAASEPPR
jgi:hypothetical protein